MFSGKRERITAERRNAELPSPKNVAVLGPIKAGKSNLVRALLEKSPSESYECTSNAVHSHDTERNIHYWDTSGDKKYKVGREFSLRSADKVLLVFNQYEPPEYFSELNDLMVSIKKVSPKATIILVKNSDHPKPEQALDEELIKDFMKKNGIVNFIQASPSKPEEIEQLRDLITDAERPQLEKAEQLPEDTIEAKNPQPPASKPDKTLVEDALQMLLNCANTRKETEKDLMLDVHVILKEILDSENPEECFRQNESLIQDKIQKLKMISSSLKNSIYNISCIAMSAVVVATDYMRGLVIRNKQERDDFSMFQPSEPGSKQLTETAVEHVRRFVKK